MPLCRLCLQVSNIYHQMSSFHPEGIPISQLLTAVVPELYPGVSKSPIICNVCLEKLATSYYFRKQCLETEKHISTFMIASRKNHAHVDLFDVVLDIERRKKINQNLTDQPLADLVATHNGMRLVQTSGQTPRIFLLQQPFIAPQASSSTNPSQNTFQLVESIPANLNKLPTGNPKDVIDDANSFSFKIENVVSLRDELLDFADKGTIIELNKTPVTPTQEANVIKKPSQESNVLTSQGSDKINTGKNGSSKEQSLMKDVHNFGENLRVEKIETIIQNNSEIVSNLKQYRPLHHKKTKKDPLQLVSHTQPTSSDNQIHNSFILPPSDKPPGYIEVAKHATKPSFQKKTVSNSQPIVLNNQLFTHSVQDDNHAHANKPIKTQMKNHTAKTLSLPLRIGSPEPLLKTPFVKEYPSLKWKKIKPNIHTYGPSPGPKGKPKSANKSVGKAAPRMSVKILSGPSNTTGDVWENDIELDEVATEINTRTPNLQDNNVPDDYVYMKKEINANVLDSSSTESATSGFECNEMFSRLDEVSSPYPDADVNFGNLVEKIENNIYEEYFLNSYNDAVRTNKQKLIEPHKDVLQTPIKLEPEEHDRCVDYQFGMEENLNNLDTLLQSLNTEFMGDNLQRLLQDIPAMEQTDYPEYINVRRIDTPVKYNLAPLIANTKPHIIYPPGTGPELHVENNADKSWNANVEATTGQNVDLAQNHKGTSSRLNIKPNFIKQANNRLKTQRSKKRMLPCDWEEYNKKFIRKLQGQVQQVIDNAPDVRNGYVMCDHDYTNMKFVMAVKQPHHYRQS